MSAISSISLNNSLTNLGLNIALSACLGGMVARYFEPIFLQKGLLAGALVGATNSLVQEAAFSNGKVERDSFTNTKTVITGATLAVLFFASGTTAAASLLNRIGLELPESLMLNIIFASAVTGQGLTSVEASKVARDAIKERDEVTKKVDDANEKVSEAEKKVEEAKELAEKAEKKVQNILKSVGEADKGVRDILKVTGEIKDKREKIEEMTRSLKRAVGGLIVVSGCSILACAWALMNLTTQCEQ